MTDEIASFSDLSADPALAVAERQLVMLGELARVAMEVSLAFASSSIAASRAAETILSDQYFMPEVGRARGCGAKDAAEAFQKVSRSLRLTLMLEMTTAEAVRDLRAGIVPAQPENAVAAGTPKPRRIVMNDEPETAATTDRPDADGGGSDRDERLGGDRERVEFERPEVLPRGLYATIVDRLAADVGATIDWDTDTVRAPDLDSVSPTPPRDPPVSRSSGGSASTPSPRAGPPRADAEVGEGADPPGLNDFLLTAHPGEGRDPDQRSGCANTLSRSLVQRPVVRE